MLIYNSTNIAEKKGKFLTSMYVFVSEYTIYFLEVDLLSDIVGEYFEDRCTAAFIDLSYPSNSDTFNFATHSTPYILVKRPNEMGKMFEQMDWMSSKSYNLTLTNISDWGELFSNQLIRKSIP